MFTTMSVWSTNIRIMLTAKKTNNDSILSVMMDGNIVEELISHNYLGVTIANDVNWRRHIENVATSIAKCLHVLM